MAENSYVIKVIGYIGSTLYSRIYPNVKGKTKADAEDKCKERFKNLFKGVKNVKIDK